MTLDIENHPIGMTAPHDKLAGIASGERVRVTMEGVMGKPDAFGIRLYPDGPGSDHEMWVSGFMRDAPTFQIERIEPPFQVGQMIRNRGEIGVILAVGGTFAWVKLHTTTAPVTLLVADLERIA